MTAYTTPDGYILTYDASLDAWTDGDLEFTTGQLVDDLYDILDNEPLTGLEHDQIISQIETLRGGESI